jgi:hypothetical protein
MKHPLRAAGAVVIALGLMAGIHAVAAHYSTTMFDYSRKLTVDGTIKPGDRVRARINPLRDTEQRGGTLDTVTLLESGKTFGTNNREEERPNLD